MRNNYNLSGKTALITGGGQGIGKSIVLALAKAGADIIINFRSNTKLAEETAEEVKDLGRKIWLWPLIYLGRCFGKLSEIHKRKTLSACRYIHSQCLSSNSQSLEPGNYR